MSPHNISSGKHRSLAWDKTLADLSGWTLIVRCQPCGRQLHQNIAALARRWPTRTLGPALMALRCPLCGQAPALAHIEGGGRRVHVLGPQSC